MIFCQKCLHLERWYESVQLTVVTVAYLVVFPSGVCLIFGHSILSVKCDNICNKNQKTKYHAFKHAVVCCIELYKYVHSTVKTSALATNLQ